MAQTDATLLASDHELAHARTVAGGASPHGAPASSLAHDATIAAPSASSASSSAYSAVATGATLDAGSIGSAPGSTGLRSTRADRTTVLPRAEDAAPGSVVEGGGLLRFEPVRSLGAGGMGEVALVQDQDIGRKVAVKRLLPGLNLDALERFAREVRIVGRLEHPGIVPVHDVGIDGEGRHYFVMKYVEGETLETIIEKLRAGDPLYVARFPVGRRVEIFHELLQAVRYAHAHGVIHRDIKPSNVMIGAYGEVLLMDWGIAKELGARERALAAAEPEPSKGAGADPKAAFRTRHGALLGTPAYMAPEQARGEIPSLDARCDTYALSVLFHELLTLRHYLADKQTLEELVFAIGNDEEPGFMQLVDACARQGAGAELVHFLKRGLRKPREARYQSVDEMMEVLASIRDDRIKVQCHLTLARRITGALSRRANRHPNLATVLGLIAIVVFVAWLVSLGVSVVHLAAG
jgi:serine/threonine-protein kinase